MKADTRTLKQKYTEAELYTAEQIMCEVFMKQICDSKESEATKKAIELFRQLKNK